MDELPVDGAAVSIFGSTSFGSTVYVSNDAARTVDDLQFDLGEGPRWVAASTRKAVLLPDLAAADHKRWPVFGVEVQTTEVRGLFVYPMTLGALDVGVIELHSMKAEGFTAHEEVIAARLVAQATWSLARRLLTLTTREGTELLQTSTALSRREVHLATGIVTAQTRTSVTDALLLLKGHAFAQGQSLRETAKAVVHQHLDFTSLNS
ncbi:GAF and ANTAR domain-containing protein [Arthrobacter sp. PL16]|uniref:GAF and ANTAR domain-containing protein n=1 Tax=Arthrobacter sp. PL16 TaxID=3071720 RepID=UPI002E0E9012